MAVLARPGFSIQERPSATWWRATWDGVSRWPAIPALIIVLFVICALFGPWIAPQDPFATDLRARLSAPSWAGGSSAHFLGTDQLGRDIFSRVIVGARTSFIVGLVALAFGSVLGSVIGLASAFLGGRTDSILMRIADAAISFPIILLALLLATAMGPGLAPVVISAALVLWARFSRLIRSEVLAVKEREFVTLARVTGASNARLMFVHILPNVLNSVMVLLTLQLGFVILLEATLSFLGAGIPPPTPTWGEMVSSGRAYITSAWWLTLFPGIAIALVVLAFNLIGDWLRDHLDPRLRQL
jgi:peptide/nickel transport system permease protein